MAKKKKFDYKFWKSKKPWEPNIFDKIQSFFRHQINSIKNLIIWAPIIYKDRQFDHCFLLEILVFKFSLMEKYFRYHGVAVGNERCAKQIQICKNLCKRISYGYWDQSGFEQHWKKWGDIVWEPYLGHANCKTDEDYKKEREESQKLLKKEDYLRDQDIELLFKIMKKHMLGWWD